MSSFPTLGANRLVSTDGAAEPRWSHTGRELFYKSGGYLVAVDVPPGPTFSPGLPRRLFPLAGFRDAWNRQQYDVSPDDSRFLMIRELGGGESREVMYVENWLTELKAKVKQ